MSNTIWMDWDLGDLARWGGPAAGSEIFRHNADRGQKHSARAAAATTTLERQPPRLVRSWAGLVSPEKRAVGMHGRNKRHGKKKKRKKNRNTRGNLTLTGNRPFKMNEVNIK